LDRQTALTANRPEEAATLAPALGSHAAADGTVLAGKTYVRLHSKTYPDGFEQSRIPRRDHTVPRRGRIAEHRTRRPALQSLRCLAHASRPEAIPDRRE
jgi:hypothetical protein